MVEEEGCSVYRPPREYHVQHSPSVELHSESAYSGGLVIVLRTLSALVQKTSWAAESPGLVMAERAEVTIGAIATIHKDRERR